MNRTGIWMGMLLTLLMCCGLATASTSPDAAPPTVALTVTTSPTYTLLPIATSTLAATFTPAPTSTPPATQTPVPTPTPERQAALVVRVIDGDTIEVQIDAQTYRVRYIGMDTPETVHPNQPVMWLGPEATAANAQLVAGQTVYLEKDVSDTDRYGRLLRYVFLADGTHVNAELVRLGYAQVSTYPPDVKYQELYQNLQTAAREAGQGLWGPTPTPTSLPPTTLPTIAPTPRPTAMPATVTPQAPPTTAPPTAAPTLAPTVPGPELAPGVWACPDATAGAVYVGSAKSDKFHFPGCRHARQIAQHNRICFISRAAAVNYGYQPCGGCNP